MNRQALATLIREWFEAAGQTAGINYVRHDSDTETTIDGCFELAELAKHLLPHVLAATFDAELRALVAGWRAHWSVQPQGADKESAMFGGGIELCADDLEKWLDGKKPNV